MVHLQSCCFANQTYCFFDVLVTIRVVGTRVIHVKSCCFTNLAVTVSSFLKVPDRDTPDRTCRIAGYIPPVRLHLILAYLFREEVNKEEPGLFYWIYMFFFWTQCISTVVLAVLIAAKRNEDGPTFVVKVRPT